MEAPLPRTQLPRGSVRRAAEDAAEEEDEHVRLQEADNEAARTRRKQPKKAAETAMGKCGPLMERVR